MSCPLDIDGVEARQKAFYGRKPRQPRHPCQLTFLCSYGQLIRQVGAIRVELRKLLGAPVDVLTPNGSPDKFRARGIAETRPL